MKKKSCAIIGWEEGLSGQISQWITYKIKYYIHPFDNQPKIDLKKIKNKPSKKFEHPKKGEYLNTSFIAKKDWCQFLKKKKISNVLILVSDGTLRMNLIKEALKNKIKVLSAIHQSSVILNKKKNIGIGSIIEPFVFIGHNVEIKNGVIIQERSSIEHNSVIEDGVTINPGSQINGNCLIKKNTTLHSMSLIFNNIRIGKNSIVGAGSLVNKNFGDNVTIWGTPAKIKRRKFD